MYVKIRKIVAKLNENDLTINISKKAKIEELRDIIQKEFKVNPEQQILLYKGKQLVNGHKILDYDIRLNDVIQLLMKLSPKERELKNDNYEDSKKRHTKSEFEIDTTSKYYKIDDLIDVRLSDTGAWSEAKITKIFTRKNSEEVETEENDLFFRVISEDHVHVVGFEIDAKFREIRPRSYCKFNVEDLKVDMLVLVNYNLEKPKTRGLWYDCKITDLVKSNVKGTIFFGEEKASIENCSIHFIDEIMRIETSSLLTDRNTDEFPTNIIKRTYPINCEKCKDVRTRKCRECGCKICAGKENIDKIILCDDCDYGYHINCLNPPLESVPEDDEWYCPECKTDDSEIVKAGEKLKVSKKKANMPSNKAESTRDWGKGMACVGRTKECTLVERNHFGPIPGVEVGTCWKYRIQVSEAGIHRALVAGIHGRENEGAYSLVLSGGYEDDVDNGNEFYYTGSGGRDLSGNKRINKQSCDQILTRMNKALAMNCYAPVNNKTGAESKDWKKGKPVRVVRNFKGAVHSKYAPKDGNRYDGLYKIVKYYPEKGISGFIVWKYFLRRDDPAPAPWEKGGQELEMIYPPGYLEAQAAAKLEKEKQINSSEKTKKATKRKKSELTAPITEFFTTSSKKQKLQEYKLPLNVRDLINSDGDNEKLWSECKKVLKDGKQRFLSKIEELFMCICCQEIVFNPVTTPCNHNTCKDCLKRSFTSEIYTCPYCRYELGKEFKMEMNKYLGQSLLLLFPGYETAR